MRRKHLSERDLRRHRRLIPAHAGKTPRSRGAAARTWAHPRSRGENALEVGHLHFAAGSSPLTRGKPNDVDGFDVGPGLIPAHAGKTPTRARTATCSWAHPRSRGENTALRRRGHRFGGSSPLTRGKPKRTTASPADLGLIPAHAGKTEIPGFSLFSYRAHPRSRGENMALASALSAARGSSPLTRGKHQVGDRSELRQRLIPAHAGKTSGRRSRARRTRAHPRSRGENATAGHLPRWARGSSPLTRGKQGPGMSTTTRARLIPAHAGKTLPRDSLQRGRRAHPRSRGENRSASSSPSFRVGSSPLTRGKRVAAEG